MLWVGVYLVLEGQLTIGQLIAFRIISGNVVGPIIRLVGTWQTIQSLQISIERLADVVCLTEQADDANLSLYHQSREVERKTLVFASILTQHQWLSLLALVSTQVNL